MVQTNRSNPSPVVKTTEGRSGFPTRPGLSFGPAEARALARPSGQLPFAAGTVQQPARTVSILARSVHLAARVSGLRCQSGMSFPGVASLAQALRPGHADPLSEVRYVVVLSRSQRSSASGLDVLLVFDPLHRVEHAPCSLASAPPSSGFQFGRSNRHPEE